MNKLFVTVVSGLGCALLGAIARADVAPPPGYVEKCTVERTCPSGKECVLCPADFHDLDSQASVCSKNLGSQPQQIALGLPDDGRIAREQPVDDVIVHGGVDDIGSRQRLPHAPILAASLPGALPGPRDRVPAFETRCCRVKPTQAVRRATNLTQDLRLSRTEPLVSISTRRRPGPSAGYPAASEVVCVLACSGSPLA